MAEMTNEIADLIYDAYARSQSVNVYGLSPSERRLVAPRAIFKAIEPVVRKAALEDAASVVFARAKVWEEKTKGQMPSNEERELLEAGLAIRALAGQP